MLYIRRLRVCSFTAFEELNLEFASGVNVFVGENATGKSHLLKLLFACLRALATGREIGKCLHNAFFPPNEPAAMQLGRLVRRGVGDAKAFVRIDFSRGSLEFEFSRKAYSRVRVTSSPPPEMFKGLGTVFVPPEEMLVHAPGFYQLWVEGGLHFDETYAEVVRIAGKKPRRGPRRREWSGLLARIEDMLGIRPRTLDGVYAKGGKFFLRSKQGEIEFELVSEGYRSLALIWLLVRNGSLGGKRVLLWDEPEAHICPTRMQLLAEILWSLTDQGAQIFLATHNYFFLKHLELQRANRSWRVHSLYFAEPSKRLVKCESHEDIYALQQNPVIGAFNQIRELEIKRAFPEGESQ